MSASRPSQSASHFFSTISRCTRELRLYPAFNINELRIFARTCHKAEQESALQRLLNYAIRALPESGHETSLLAIALLRRHPELLFERDIIRSPAGHLIRGSAYQIFLGMGDKWALGMIHDEILPLIADSRRIARKQYEQQFSGYSDGQLHDKRNLEQIAQLNEDLNEVVAALRDDPCKGGKATRQRTINALQVLREHLTPQANVIIETGLYSPPEILKQIHRVYNQHFHSWTIDKIVLFSTSVIGFAQSIASAVDAQVYSTRANDFNRSTPLIRNVTYFSASGDANGLGESRFIDVFHGQSHQRVFAVRRRIHLSRRCHKMMREYCDDKTNCLLGLHASLTNDKVNNKP